MSSFFSCIWIIFTQIHNNIWGYNHILNMTWLLHEYDAIIYAYICSMVKNRMFTVNRYKLCAILRAAAMARGSRASGALAYRYRTTNGPLVIRYRDASVSKKKDLIKGLSKYILQLLFSKYNCFKVYFNIHFLI